MVNLRSSKGKHVVHRVMTAENLWPAIVLPNIAAAYKAQLATLTETKWRRLIGKAQQHSVASLLYVAVQPFAADLPADVVELLRAIYRQAVLLSMQRIAELRQLLDALAVVGICPVVFKGAALAHTLYPSPACRMMGDIDLWVTHAEMPAAIATLTDLGYQMHEQERRPHALTQQTDGEVQMLAGRPGQGLVELHWGVFPGEWLAHTTVVDRAGVRSRLVKGRLVDRPVYLLAPEDALLQLAVHASINHQMTKNVLRCLVDVALFSQQPLDWALVSQRATAWRVATAVGLTLELTQRIFDLPPLPEVIQRLAPQGWQRCALEKFVSPQAIVEGQQLSANRRRFFYLLCATDRKRDSLRLVKHTIWPDAAWLAARYGRSDWTMRLRHAANSATGNI